MEVLRKENDQNQVIRIKRKEYYLMKPRSREQSSEGESETEKDKKKRKKKKKNKNTSKFRH